MNAVELNDLAKAYTKDVFALCGISLTLPVGEIFGFLGPNGAGKTTTVKLLGGMLAPTRGSCRVFGICPTENPALVHSLSGVVTEHAQMYDYLTGLENLEFFGGLFGLGVSECKSRAGELLRQLDLTDAAGKKLAAYSTGMRQRLSLARAMMHRPKILFLDEPTSGLSPESVQSVNAMIQSLAANEGTTVFLCTHQLRYAEELCTSYGLIAEGALLALGDITKLREIVQAETRVTIETNIWPSAIPCRKASHNTYEVAVASKAEIPAIVRCVVEGGGDIYRVTPKEASLEEIYFALLKKGDIHD